MNARVRACVRVCMRVCVRACSCSTFPSRLHVRACMCVCLQLFHLPIKDARACVRACVCACLQLFHLPIKDVAVLMGVSVSHLKKTSRSLGIKAWPHRKLHSMEALRLAVMEQDGAAETEKSVRASSMSVHGWFGALDGSAGSSQYCNRRGGSRMQ